MQFNTRVRYGLRAMMELALNTKTGKPLYQKDIAKNQIISNKYLDQIIAALKAAGLINNSGGKKSGYILSRKPEEIRIYDIFRAFEPELSIVGCLSNNLECERNNSCAGQDFYYGLNKILIEYMHQHTLKNLSDNQIQKDQTAHH
ncbi:MAG: Rrf2 family transcriptional regulator [Bacteroidales bacterium]|jgi:Rrf2 family protein|nr:Rrf2 family transcriptional regulator [Bacteroidales bacterium]